MAIKIKKTYWLPKIKSQWNGLYSQNPHLSAFQAYDFVLRFWKNYYVYCLKRREVPVFYLVEEDGEPRLIAPLCKKKNGYIIFGAENGCEYCDFIYGSNADVPRYLTALKQNLQFPIQFERVRESSKLFDACKNIASFREVGTMPNVNIILPNNFADYNKSLSKSMRQNIRTAYNRLNKEGHKLSLNIMHGDRALTYNYDYAGNAMQFTGFMGGVRKMNAFALC